MRSLVRRTEDTPSRTSALWFRADGWVPNNPQLPLLLYRRAIPLDQSDAAGACEDLLRRNGWCPQWRNGVYPFHHYHSTAHEVLGFVAGRARILLGGPHGEATEVEAGDCALLPAGAGHCRIEASADFLVVGGYPPGQDWDLRRDGLTQQELDQMAKLPYPKSDPIYGARGPLARFWTKPQAN